MNLMIGQFDLELLAPTTVTQAAAVGLAVSAGILFNTPGVAVAGLAAAWAWKQAKTRHLRDGYWLASPYRHADPTPTTKPAAVLNFDTKLTSLYRDIFDTDSVMVSREDASQYQIHIIWHNGLNIASKLVPIALSLGIESLPNKKGAEAIPVILFEVWRAGCSALLIQKQPDQWGKPVTFKPEHITPGQPRAYIGDAINGKPLIIDHAIEHGAGVFGTSGSGKSEVFVAHHRSMQLTGLNPEVNIIDLKGTPQLARLKADAYVSKTTDENGDKVPDIHGAYALLQDLNTRLSNRQAVYTAANCDNIWQYRKNVNPNERLISLYMDELAVISRAARTAPKGDPVANIMELLATVAQLGRSAGLILMVGMQHPIADDLPTVVRNQIMTRIVLAVADADAAKVAGIPGAQNQPMQGAMMLKHGNRIQIGRGAYIPGDTNAA